MNLVEAVAEIESWFTVWPEQGNYGEAPTGEPYVTIVSGGLLEEGELAPLLCTSEEVAVKMWLVAVTEYARNEHSRGLHGNALYWRTMPEMAVSEIFFVDTARPGQWDTRSMPTQKVYRVYSRLLVSGKPRTQPAIRPLSAA